MDFFSGPTSTLGLYCDDNFIGTLNESNILILVVLVDSANIFFIRKK